MISKGHVHMRFVLKGLKTLTRSLHCPPNLNSLIEALTGFRHMYCPDGLSTTSLTQGCVLGAVSGGRKGRQNPHSKGGEGQGASNCWGPAHGTAGSHVFSRTVPNR